MLRVAVVILVIMLAYGGIFSLMNIIVPKAIMGSVLKATTGKTPDNAQDDGYAEALKFGQRNGGLFGLVTSISGFFILFAAFRKAQKWAWWAFLIVASIIWLWALVYQGIVIGDKMNIPFAAIGIVLFLVGILIPIKAFFGKEAEEAPQEAQETQQA